MKHTFAFLAVFFLLAFSVTSCFNRDKPSDPAIAADSASTKKDGVKITAADSGKTFRVKTGSEFEATFNQCVGCAESWKVAADEGKIEALPNTYSNRSCTNCVGGSQDNTFHFKAKAAGQSTLTFTYFKQTVVVTIIAE